MSTIKTSTIKKLSRMKGKAWMFKTKTIIIQEYTFLEDCLRIATGPKQHIDISLESVPSTLKEFLRVDLR